jgi:integrase
MATLTGERSHLCGMVTLAINTGLRVNELFGLKREDVDFHRDVLYIKHTKTDEDREVPLNDTARELLRELMQSDRKGGEFLFTNPKTGTRYTSIKTAWLTACRNARALQPSLSRSASHFWNESGRRWSTAAGDQGCDGTQVNSDDRALCSRD